MNTEKSETKDIGQIFRDGTAIEEALERAYRRAVKQHRQNGVPMVFWENGKSLKFPPINSPIFPSTDENFTTVTHRTDSIAIPLRFALNSD